MHVEMGEALARPDVMRRPTVFSIRHIDSPQARAVGFILDHQLLDRNLWTLFTSQFKAPGADNDGGWRGEYWGKMMMGACFILEATGDQRLYEVVEQTVRDILACERDDGRISTYDTAHELTGWDLWSRKYVMVGLEYFLPLCRDDRLADGILQSLCRQMDAILAVALGGNALSGGKFNMGSSILGAYVIQFLTTTLYKFNVASAALPAYKAVVVIALVVLSAPLVRTKLSAFWKKIRSPKQTEVEVAK